MPVPDIPPGDCAAAHHSDELRRRGADAGPTIHAVIAAGGGVASAAALRAAGVHRNAVARRLRDGRLVEPFAGVFALGVLPDAVRRRAAVLSCGAGAVLADWSCAEHRGLITFQEPADDRVHVIVGERRCPRRSGIAVHRVGTLDHRDVVEHDGVRCLTVARLLLRLAATRDARFVERLIDEAAYQGSWRPWEVEELLVRTRGQRGHAVLEQAFRRHVPGTTRTQNELEEAFLAICDAQGWPRPICQQPDTLRSGRRIRHDFLWPDLRVAGETDGGRGHAGAYRQARDAERDADLRARGIEVVRAQWDEVFHRPAVVVARVGPVLLARGARFGRPRRR